MGVCVWLLAIHPKDVARIKYVPACIGAFMYEAKTFVAECAPSSFANNLLTSCQSSTHESMNPGFVCGVPFVV